MFLPHKLKSLVTVKLNRNRQQGNFKVLKSNNKYNRMNNDLKMLQQSINKEIVIKKKT